MARVNSDLLQLNIDSLFEEHKIEEIIEIEKLLDAEIERKRVELRSMVGDRYKDVLVASDAIKNMKTISQDIVDNIQSITNVCENLTTTPSKPIDSTLNKYKHSHEERVLIIQIRLAIVMNEQIWICLDNEDNLTAAQFYLLAQHIHMELSLSKVKYLNKLPLLKQIKANLQTIRDQIFHKIKQKLQSVEIDAAETSSNLNALLLLQNQSTSDLLNIFISHRKTALNTVIKTSHVSVRIQVSAMVRCLITTVHLLHDCFMSCGDNKKGLIWQQLEEIVKDSSIPTLSKIELPISPLNVYIPEMIKQFRPKYKSAIGEPIRETIALEDWLESTKKSVREGLETSLKLVTNVRGLNLIREEVLKIELPNNWQDICSESKLPDNFNVWYNFFQTLMTSRARDLISKRINTNFNDLEKDVTEVLNKRQESAQETDLRWYTWEDNPADVSRVENKHTGLTMKTLGYSENIVHLCDKLDSKYLELLMDTSQYLYGREFDQNINVGINFTDAKANKRKYIDKEELELHLRTESSKIAELLTEFLINLVKLEKNNDNYVRKSLICARFLQAIPNQCPHFTKCCTFNGSGDNWSKICAHFQRNSIIFWENWIEKCVKNVEKEARNQFSKIDACSMISILPRWDTIEIQEQTEEKIFKSQIKVPLKPSLALHNILNKLNDEFSYILPQTLPKQIHLQTIEKSTTKTLEQYNKLVQEIDLNQNQALQFLFDVKFLTTFCIPRENSHLISISQQICDKLRVKIDPFDLDVFYSHLQTNVKRAVLQSQVIFGCLLPSTGQLANLGVSEKSKDQDREPSILALSCPSANTWFPLLPISVPSQKLTVSAIQPPVKGAPVQNVKTTPKKSQDPTTVMRSSAAALFGGLTTDWFT